jgi:hypothetical protein
LPSCEEAKQGRFAYTASPAAHFHPRSGAPLSADESREWRESCYLWNVLTRPSLLLRAEGGIIFGASLLLYGKLRSSWILLVVLVLAPDLSMLGYLLGIRLGTALYNLFHVLVAPLLLIALSIFYQQLWLLPYGLIWTAHIGVDRLLGYGLKYPTRFHDTHFQRL